MPDTILNTAANKWWWSIEFADKMRLMNKYGIDRHYNSTNIPTDETVRMYNGEHPGKSPEDFEMEIQERKEIEIPLKLKQDFCRAAREYASVNEGGVTINNPERYSAFRDGQDNAFAILKSDYPSDSIQSMNEEYLKLKAHVKVLREALDLVVGSMSLERVERFDILDKAKSALELTK
jgi:hypothetical protein